MMIIRVGSQWWADVTVPSQFIILSGYILIEVSGHWQHLTRIPMKGFM
jgi:hypothetical protein